MYRLQVRQLVVVRVDAGAEEEPRVPPVHDLVVPELYEVGLVFLVAGCYEAVDLFSSAMVWMMGRREEGEEEGKYLALELDLLFVVVWRVPFCETGLAPEIVREV